MAVFLAGARPETGDRQQATGHGKRDIPEQTGLRRNGSPKHCARGPFAATRRESRRARALRELPLEDLRPTRSLARPGGPSNRLHASPSTPERSCVRSRPGSRLRAPLHNWRPHPRLTEPAARRRVGQGRSSEAATTGVVRPLRSRAAAQQCSRRSATALSVCYFPSPVARLLFLLPCRDIDDPGPQLPS